MSPESILHRIWLVLFKMWPCGKTNINYLRPTCNFSPCQCLNNCQTPPLQREGEGGKGKDGRKKLTDSCGTPESVWHNTKRQIFGVGFFSDLEDVLKETLGLSWVWQCLNYSCNISIFPSALLTQSNFFFVCSTNLESFSTSLATTVYIYIYLLVMINGLVSASIRAYYLAFPPSPFLLPPSPASKAAICSF